MPRQHQRFTPWIVLLASIGTIANAFWFSTVRKDVNPYGIGYQKIMRSLVRCNLSQTPNTGTMIGPDGPIHRWAAHRKLIQRELKMNASNKGFVERLCDFKIFAISVLSFIGSVCALNKATLKADTHALQCTTAGSYNAFLPNWSWLRVWPWSCLCGHPLHQPCGSLSNCCMFDHP